MGMTEKNFKEILEEKVDVITMGNHTWGKKDTHTSEIAIEVFDCKNHKISEPLKFAKEIFSENLKANYVKYRLIIYKICSMINKIKIERGKNMKILAVGDLIGSITSTFSSNISLKFFSVIPIPSAEFSPFTITKSIPSFFLNSGNTLFNFPKELLVKDIIFILAKIKK